MSLTIIPVRTEKQKREFIRLPYRLYRDNPNWVPPLIMEQKRLLNTAKHPFYKHAAIEMLLATRNGSTVGRIAAVADDKFIDFHQERIGFFGFFECDLRGGGERARETTHALLNAAEEWLREKEMVEIRGPTSPSTNYECGTLVKGFDSPPVIMMPYNPPEYPQLIESAGFEKGRDLISYIFDLPDMPEKAYRVSRICERRGYLLRPVNMKRFEQEAETMLGIYNSAWEKNWGFVPMSDEEFMEMAAQMKQIVVPDLILMAEHRGKIVGFSIGLPDINIILKRMNGRLFPFGLFKFILGFRRINLARILVLGVAKEHRRQGIDAMMTIRSFIEGHKHGYFKGDFGWILDDNEVTNNLMLGFGSRPYKRFRIYRKPL
ncbi:MAG: N-acetyltransferase [Planctomycetota bacterium]